MMSTKKRDTMTYASPTGTNPPATQGAQANQPLTMAASVTNSTYGAAHVVLYSPTKRWLTSNGSQIAAQRTNTRTYVKGVREVIQIIPSDSSTWWWRRVVFSFKDAIGPPTANNRLTAAQVNPNDVTYRWQYDLTGDPTASATDNTKVLDSVMNLVFKGVFGTDWTQPHSAKLDTTRINVMSDSRSTISSGNEEARPRIFKRWHGVNKSLVFDDDENGTTITPSNISVGTKQGMGNLYIVDFFTCPVPSSPGTGPSNTALRMSIENTTYWHEK